LENFKPEQTADDLVKTIFNYIKHISRLKDFDEIIMTLADMGRDLVGADRATVWLVDEGKKTIWTKVAHGVDRIEVPSGSGIVGCAIQMGEHILINDAYNDERFDKTVDKKTGYETRNIMTIPFRDADDKVIGAFQAINKMTGTGYFTDKDMEHLNLAALYLGSEISSLLLRLEIENTQKEIIFTMAEVGEMRSKETGNHVRRVAEYSKILALGLGMTELESELLKMASPMHDIGKVAIPDAVLLKPGKLDEEEFKIMKSHAYSGYKMLHHSDRRILRAAATIAYEHHEKWNGKGYPRRLSGEEIHIFGRITAIADVFDALGSDRVYKDAWELDRILNLFREEKGEHFDPNLIDVFFENLDEILHIRDKYKDIYK